MSDKTTTIDLDCPHCGAIREIDENFEFIKCEFCGASEPYIEPANVKAERLKLQNHENEAKLQAEKLKTYKEVEMQKAEMETISKVLTGGVGSLLNSPNAISNEINHTVRKVKRTVRMVVTVIIILILLPLIISIIRSFL